MGIPLSLGAPSPLSPLSQHFLSGKSHLWENGRREGVFLQPDFISCAFPLHNDVMGGYRTYGIQYKHFSFSAWSQAFGWYHREPRVVLIWLMCAPAGGGSSHDVKTSCVRVSLVCPVSAHIPSHSNPTHPHACTHTHIHTTPPTPMHACMNTQTHNTQPRPPPCTHAQTNTQQL